MVLRLASYIRSRELGFRVPRIHGQLSIGNKLPQDALNPAHGSLLRVNSPSHEIFSKQIHNKRGVESSPVEPYELGGPTASSSPAVGLEASKPARLSYRIFRFSQPLPLGLRDHYHVLFTMLYYQRYY